VLVYRYVCRVRVDDINHIVLSFVLFASVVPVAFVLFASVVPVASVVD
jgi:hypothetical protein